MFLKQIELYMHVEYSYLINIWNTWVYYFSFFFFLFILSLSLTFTYYIHNLMNAHSQFLTFWFLLKNSNSQDFIKHMEHKSLRTLFIGSNNLHYYFIFKLCVYKLKNAFNQEILNIYEILFTIRFLSLNLTN